MHAIKKCCIVHANEYEISPLPLTFKDLLIQNIDYGAGTDCNSAAPRP